MSEEEIEKRSLHDLDTILQAAQKSGIKLVLIGGYAVAAYTRGYRYTKDIDLVAEKPDVGRLKGLLKGLSYSIRDTEFGLAGSKRVNKGFIDLHISVARIYDVSTGKEYPVDSLLFKNATRMTVKGHSSRASSLKAAVIDLGDLIVLKMMTVGRDKDTVDLLSLFHDRRGDIEMTVVAERAKAANLVQHLMDRIRDYARKLRDGELDEVWFNVTATRLPHTEKREIGSLLSKLAELLRQS